MASIAASAALTVPEHRALDRLVASLERELGDHLHAVWLYGSRARGEWREESDIDVLVIASVPRETEKRVDSLVETAAESEGLYCGWFSVFLYTPEWVADRRAIEAWLIQAVDRDKIVLWGGEVDTPAEFSPRVENGPVRLRTQEYLRDAREKLEVAKLAGRRVRRPRDRRRLLRRDQRGRGGAERSRSARADSRRAVASRATRDRGPWPAFGGASPAHGRSAEATRASSLRPWA